MLHGLMVEARLSGSGWEGYKKESAVVLPVLSDFPSLLVAPSGVRLASPMCWKGTSLSTISHVFVPIFLFGRRVVQYSTVVYVEGVGFRPIERGAMTVLVWRGVVAGCTHISCQKYVHEK